ncbi:MAG: hypothetical protein MMC23_004226 [Stictis urceolatum]|nr:hypothetical protein [Stictis urceolata]
MLGSDTAQRVRKGTKSCAECDVKYGVHEFRNTLQLPSRYRISQLESKVASLNKAVRNIESQLGHQHIQTPDRTTDHFSASNISDDDSTVSDVVPGNQPSQLRSLFQNDWLSIDTGRDERSGKTRAKSKTHILDAAREALQKLIPSKDEISNVAKSATTWLSLLHTLLPQSFVIKSGTEMLQVYDDMQDSHVDTLALASWMLIVALTAQQVPYVRDRSETLPSNYQNLLDFSRAVSETVESKLLLHDKLISTTEGLAVAMDFFRLQMIQGNFQKAWLRLRHNIAIAELMGLPKSFQAVQLEKTNGSAPSETLFYRAQMWEVLYTADRISAMVMNLPPATSRYQQAKTQSLISNGVVQPQAYLNRLTYIAVNVPYSTGTTTALKSDRELHTTAMTLAKELSLLASEVPKSWWNGAAEKFKPDQMVQFLHYCVAMRVHLPFAITEDTGDDNSYSRKACIDACQSVARRYVSLRRKLPPGIFLSRVLDLQLFINHNQKLP